jgi:hypothetical protein
MLTALLLFAVASHALSPVCVNSTCILGGVVDALLELVQRPEQTLVVSGVRCSDTVPNCKLQLVARTIEFVDANVTVGTLEANATTVEAKSGVVRSNQVLSISASGNVTVHGAVFTGGNILIAADSVTLSGGARISASGAGAIKPNPDADTALGASGQIYGAGGGHSSGYGIKPISYAIVAPMNVPFPPVVADDYRKPVVGGLVGGAATPDASIANLTSPTGPMAGGAPGGSVRLLLTGALTVGKDSSVEANGLEPQVTTTLACATGAYRVGCDVRKPEVSLVGGGGGGGGSVWIDALSILGDGQITANGGSVIKIRIPIAGALTEVASPGGAGGGGRVALYYRDQVAPTIVVRATGGRSQEFTAYGTAGFVYLKNMRTFAEELVLDNDYNQQQNPWPPTTLPAGAFAALTLRGAAIARAPAAALNVALLTMSAKAQLRAASPFGDLVIRSDEVKLSDGARVAAGVVDISAQRIDITGMTTEVTAAGTASGSPADGASTASGGGGGGGPQAPGGGCMSVAGGAQSINGKGGRGGSVMTNLGGNGGGIVRLNAWNQLTFAMSPTVAVSGFPATSSGVAGAGGGGAGTIEIIADKIAGAARFLADGGSTKGTGGGGSGGFVVLKSANLTTLPPSITVVVNGGANEELMECKGNDGQISHDSMAVANRTRFFCRGGTFDSDSQCAQCSPGTAAPAPGATVCADCTAGFFARNAGSIECTPCAPGSAVNTGKARECALCEVGQQAVAPGAANCTACLPGTFAAMRGTAACAPCAAGQKQPMSGSDKCVPCEEGTATNGTTGATMCAQCAAGQEAPTAGTPKCLECKPGFAGAMAGEKCVPCQQGTASLFEASLLCERCPAATFAAAPASATCAPCPPGQASDIDGQVSCSPCEPGTFASEERSRSCAPCGEDQQADTKGKAACDPCPEGTYTECASFVSQETCPAMNCRWRPAEMDCVTVKCTTCATSDKRADCVRWNKFSARRSVLTSEALDCLCAAAGETVEIKMESRSALGESLASGGLAATLQLTATLKGAPVEGVEPLAPVAPTDNGDGTYLFTFAFPVEGEHELRVTADGVDVDDSPYAMKVAAAGFPDWGIAVAAVGGALLLAGGGAGIFFWARKRGRSENESGAYRMEAVSGKGNNFKTPTALSSELRSFEIRIEELVFEKEIGRGAFGVVYKGQWRDSQVAIKQLLLEETSGAIFERELKTFQDEAATMSAMRSHPNVVLLLGITPAPNLCIAAGTPVLLGDGTARTIEDVVALAAAAGKLAVHAPHISASGATVESRLAACVFGEAKRTRACVQVTLQDGRALTLTPDHQVLTSDGRWLEAQQLVVGRDRLAAAACEAPLRTPTADESAFAFAVGGVRFSMASEAERARTLALARRLGAGAQLAPAGALDRAAAQADELAACGRRSAQWWADVLAAHAGRVPAFIMRAPPSVAGEYAAGVFGARGTAPALDDDDDEAMAPPALADADADFLCDIGSLLARAGVAGCRVERDGTRLVAPSSLAFAECVGFRYSALKQLRLAAAAAFERFVQHSGADGSKQRKTGGVGEVRARAAASARQFVRSVGAGAWFDASFALAHDAAALPTLALDVVDVRGVGERELYDITVPGADAFFANGVAVHNCIVVEFASGGSLYSLLHNESLPLSNDEKIFFCKGIASGMGHLHAENIIHRDLAARNILLDGGRNPKVSDFGLSRRAFGEIENQTKSDVGPLKWMAPEAIKERIYSQKSDVWSYAVLIWEIVAREDPYPDMDALQVASRVVFNGLRLTYPFDTPPILSEIMTWCFQTDAAQRPNFRQIGGRFKDQGF